MLCLMFFQLEARRLSSGHPRKADVKDLRLMDSIVGDRTSDLWKKSANSITQRFKDPIMEAKVEELSVHSKH